MNLVIIMGDVYVAMRALAMYAGVPGMNPGLATHLSHTLTFGTLSGTVMKLSRFGCQPVIANKLQITLTNLRYSILKLMCNKPLHLCHPEQLLVQSPAFQ
jgi:hypothetical protein